MILKIGIRSLMADKTQDFHDLAFRLGVDIDFTYMDGYQTIIIRIKPAVHSSGQA